MAYKGSCHCGAVQFTVDADIPARAISCNCSHCHRQGFILTFVPASQFRLDRGEGALVDYRFNTMKLRHRFCSTCGAHPFSEGVGKDGTETRSINLRCVPDADLNAITIEQYDGRNH